MEKEVQLAIIGGIITILVAAMQYGPGIYTMINPSNDAENVTPNVTPNVTQTVPTMTINPENEPPVLNGLTPNNKSPNVAGKTIMWTANAFDQDNDFLKYRFLLSGPSTDNESVEVRGWASDNSWTWTTDNNDIGNNQVQVQVRDGNHKLENDYDDLRTMNYEIVPKDEPQELIVPTSDKAIPGITEMATNELLPDARYSGDQQTTTHQAPNTTTYQIWAETTPGELKTRPGTVDGYGTKEGKVNITMYGEYGNVSTGVLNTKKKLNPGTNCSFNIPNKIDIGDIKEIKINYKGKNVDVVLGNYYDSWHPKQVVIGNLDNKKSWTFKIDKWMIDGSKNGPYPKKPV